MAKPTDRKSFGEYCLRELGKPVININVAPEQVLDRIDEALQVYSEKHYDATEKEWVGYRLTADDIIKGYVLVPDDILVVDRIISMNSISQSYNQDPDFGWRYQTINGSFSPFRSLDLLSYYMNVTYMDTIVDLLNTTPTFEFARHTRKLKIYDNFKEFSEGNAIAIHVYKVINPDQNPAIWSDKWLKAYATALIKRQWGSNMKKHGEIQLLGGITVNGQQIFDEAVQEIKDLEDELEQDYSEPINFFIG